MTRKKADLGFQGLRQAVIPDGKIRALDLEREGKLGSDHAVCQLGREVALFCKAPELGRRGAGHGDDVIEMGFCGSFKEERDIDCQPPVAGLCADGLRQREPLSPDGRMEDRLKRLSSGRVGKDDGSKSGAH